MALTFERKLPIVLLIVFIVLAVTGFIFYQSTNSLQEAIRWEKHTQDVLLKLDETLTLMLDLETGVRGFVITGNESYLDPFARGKTRIRENIAQLKVLTADNPAQVEEVERLEALINAAIDDASAKVDLRRRVGFENSVSEIASSRGENLIDAFRASIDNLKAEELRLLHERERALDLDLYRTIWIFIIGTTAGIISIVGANLLIFRETDRRRKAENSLVEANQELENRIADRTAELQTVNESLREIAGDRELHLTNEQAARREAEIANRLRDEFMATISHELRTPLNSILGWARLMNGENLDLRQSTKAVRTIIKNAEMQNRLIEDLLDVARIISGKLELDISEIAIGEIVSHSIETARPSSHERGIRIEFQSADGAGERLVSGDRVRLEQIVGNLLNNSIKFSPPGEKVDVMLRSDDGFVEIVIKDSGAGISPEFLPSVFERFRQDDATIKESGGLGLGLAVVRNLTELHGGTVTAESEGKNKGSTFTVRLPVVQA